MNKLFVIGCLMFLSLNMQASNKLDEIKVSPLHNGVQFCTVTAFGRVHVFKVWGNCYEAVFITEQDTDRLIAKKYIDFTEREIKQAIFEDIEQQRVKKMTRVKKIRASSF